jgi:hypothetical protein
MRHDLEVVRGTTNTFELHLTGPDGEPYDLTKPETLVFGVKADKRDAECIFAKPVRMIQNSDGTNSHYFLELMPKETWLLQPGIYYYDIGLWEPGEDDNFYNVIQASKFTVLPNITTMGDLDGFI